MDSGATIKFHVFVCLRALTIPFSVDVHIFKSVNQVAHGFFPFCLQGIKSFYLDSGESESLMDSPKPSLFSLMDYVF